MEAEKEGAKDSKNGVNPKPDQDHDDQQHIDHDGDQVHMMNKPDDSQVQDQDQDHHMKMEDEDDSSEASTPKRRQVLMPSSSDSPKTPPANWSTTATLAHPLTQDPRTSVLVGLGWGLGLGLGVGWITA